MMNGSWEERTYQIKTESFFLRFEPIVVYDSLFKRNKENLHVKVRNHGFSADVVLNIDGTALREFSIALKRLYETLDGDAELEEIRGHSRFSFSCVTRGHVCVFVSLVHRQGELSFGNSFDQTFLKDFSEALFTDFGNCGK